MKTLPLFDQLNTRSRRDTRATDLFTMPVQIVPTRATPEQLLDLAKKRARRPEVFDTNPPVFLSAQISNNGIDAYFTRMAPSSLKNYARAAQEGVSFQDSHDTSRLGLGWSLAGRYIEDGQEGAHVEADFFVVPGIREIDEFIHRLDAGIANDVSIGFYGGEHRCSICGNDMWSYRCSHWPGQEYEVEERNDRGEVLSTRKEIAIAWVEDATLSEVSAVYDGATPGCVILKAEREMAEGRMTPKMAASLNQRYRGLNLRMNDARIFVPTQYADQQSDDREEGRSMSNQANQQTSTSTGNASGAPANGAPAGSGTSAASAPAERATPQPPAELDTIRTILADAGIAEADRADAVAGVRALAAKAKGDADMAEVGRRYREGLINDALKEGVRAKGEKFDQDGKRSLLEKLPISDIEQMRDEWRALGDAALPAGRQSRDAAQPQITERKGKAPAAAFSA